MKTLSPNLNDMHSISIESNTVLPLVSVETILFLRLKIGENSNSFRKFKFLPNKLNFSCENYSRAETILGNKVVKKWQERH